MAGLGSRPPNYGHQPTQVSPQPESPMSQSNTQYEPTDLLSANLLIEIGGGLDARVRASPLSYPPNREASAMSSSLNQTWLLLDGQCQHDTQPDARQIQHAVAPQDKSCQRYYNAQLKHQVDPQARQSSFQDLGSSAFRRDGPWSPHNTRAGYQQTDAQGAILSNMGTFQYLEQDFLDRMAGRVYSNETTESEQASEDAVVDPAENDLSASTVTMRPMDEGNETSQAHVYIDNSSLQLSSELWNDVLEASHPSRRCGHISADGIFSPQGRHYNSRSRNNRRRSATSDRHLPVPQGADLDPTSPGSSIVSTTSLSTPDPLACNACTSTFSGDYRKGNLARHTREKHGGGEKIYPCKAVRCPKTFKRMDARLKHHRRHHPELMSEPAVLRGRHSHQVE